MDSAADGPSSKFPPAAEQRVDELSDAADRLATKHAGTSESADAAQRAVEAAEKLWTSDSCLANQRRLARSLWRRASTYPLPEEGDAAGRDAWRCWTVCAEMLEATRDHSAAFDDVVGDIGMWAGVLVPTLGAAGQPTRASQVYENAAGAAERAGGAQGRRARMRLRMFPLAHAADVMAETRIGGGWDEQAQALLEETIDDCLEVVAVSREYRAEGAFEVSELARALQVLGRLQLVAGRPLDAAASLDESIALMTSVADEGPRYAAFFHGLQAERLGLRTVAVRDAAGPVGPQAGAGDVDEAASRIGRMLQQALEHVRDGRVAQAADLRRRTADEARDLVQRYPEHPRFREGLGSILYNLSAQLLAIGDASAAVAALDEAYDRYAGLAGTVTDVHLLVADVLARRGLARARLGRDASAAADADAAVMTYLDETCADWDHPRIGDLARVLSMNAAVLAHRGDPDLAISSAQASMAYYGSVAEHAPDGHVSDQDLCEYWSAAVVATLKCLVTGRGEEAQETLEAIMQGLQRDDAAWERLPPRPTLNLILLRCDDDPGHPEVRELVHVLTGILGGRGFHWAPGGGSTAGSGVADALGGIGSVTLAAALSRHATGSSDYGLADALLTRQPQHLVFTPAMRWFPDLPPADALRLADLAVRTLPGAYADGLRLALDAHALLATAQRRHAGASIPAQEYRPVWQALVSQTVSACRSAGDTALADDLTSWERWIADGADRGARDGPSPPTTTGSYEAS